MVRLQFIFLAVLFCLNLSWPQDNVDWVLSDDYEFYEGDTHESNGFVWHDLRVEWINNDYQLTGSVKKHGDRARFCFLDLPDEGIWERKIDLDGTDKIDYVLYLSEAIERGDGDRHDYTYIILMVVCDGMPSGLSGGVNDIDYLSHKLNPHKRRKSTIQPKLLE